MSQPEQDFAAGMTHAIEAIHAWQGTFGDYRTHPSVDVPAEEWRPLLAEYLARLTAPGEQYPFFHPHYAGQMLKPPHPVAAVGYLAAMLINPNNHALTITVLR